MEPKIRFKGFEGEWKASIIGDFCSVSIGEFVIKTKQNDNAPYPVYNGGSSYTGFYENYNQEGPKVIVSARGANAGFVNYCKKNFWAGNSCYSIATKDNRNLKFLYHCLKKNQSTYLNNQQAANIPSISKKDIQETILMMPKSFEQKAIASYFTSIDSQISAATSRLASLKQMKAASLQAMFPQEGETVPKIRFKGFEGEWKKVKLNECLEISKERNINGEYGINEVLSVSDEEGVMNQIKLLGRSFAGKSVTNYKVLRTNQVVYTKSPLKAKPYGIIKVNKGDTGIVSVLYAVYDVKVNTNPDYIHYYFDPTFRINSYLLPLINKGAKNTMNISDEVSLQGYISLPSLAEQQAIASYFTSLDRQISLQSQRLEKLKQIKSACLDKMFV